MAEALDPQPSRRRWPAEWEPQQAVLLAWPTSAATWPGRYQYVLPEFVRLARTIADFVPVYLLAPAPLHRSVRKQCGNHPDIELLDVPTNDAWIRDYGPIGIHHGNERRFVNFRFNAWGGKYPPWDRDDEAASRIAGQLGIGEERVACVVEGGALETNGRGLILATRRSLVDPRRNGAMTETELREVLRRFLGATEICLLQHGQLAGDDTDGHIDQLARFVRPDVVVVAHAEDPTDQNHVPLGQLERELRERLALAGPSIDVVRLAIPRDVTFQGNRLPASYCNFLMIPGAILVPQFYDRHDERARDVLQQLVPDRDVVGVPCRELIWGFGAVHCLTQTIPTRPTNTQTL